MIRILSITLLTATATQAFLFGGSSSCGCAPPPCAPAPVCPPAPVCGGGYAVAGAAPTATVFEPHFGSQPEAPAPQYAPQEQPLQTVESNQQVQAPGSYVEQPQAHRAEDAVYDEISSNQEKKRTKRDNEQAFDPKCNSEVLKNIILKNIHESTATAKRQIQTAASEEIGGRVDVICSSGTFSYIVNTELYCETELNGTTCFAFRQSA